MEKKADIEFILKEGEEIVISGMSGRFPESDSTDEFANNLYNKLDMITDDSRRWPNDLYGMSHRMGKLKEIDKFDGPFFGLMSEMADAIDPHSRILLETTYEAICDAGINPQTLRGTKTGVYIGYSSIGMPDGIPTDIQHDSRTSIRDSAVYIPGTGKSMYSNRISFIFDFKGPSCVIDTACSSSMVALDVAVTDLRLGKCQQAIVGGTNINLQPFTNHMYQTIRFNAPDGVSRVWDEDADGFVRGETVACLFLQRKPEAKRIYATVLHSRTNIDGYKKTGAFFPSSECQRDLMVTTYKEANIDPLEVNYFEAHGTGTKAGDLQEARAIYNAYCNGRGGKLPIGLLKSSIGHGEGACGIASVAKVIICYENERIPPNLNLNKLKTEIAVMCPPLFPVIENINYTPGIAGVNSFGVGGVNGHALLKPNYKKSDKNLSKIIDKIPRLINLCCRNEETLNAFYSFIENNPNKLTPDFLALLTDVMKVKPTLNSAGFPYKASMLIKAIGTENNHQKYEYIKQSSICIDKVSKQIWFLFPGLGGQWTAMAKALMPIDVFAEKIEESAQILKPYDIDLKYLLLSDDKNAMSTMTNKFITTTVMQIALIEVLLKLDIIPDGIIGHSFGEIACAYADGCLTTEEAILTSFWRGVVTESNNNIPKGLMAAVGLSWDETKKLCPKGVYPVCNNAKDLVTISGLFEPTKRFIESLLERKIFVRELDSNQIPYHSVYMGSSAQKMTETLHKVIKNPKMRSNKWISTSVLNLKEDKDKYASAEYFVNNLLNPVYFHNKFMTLPENAIVIEIGPHALFAHIIPKTLESANYVPLIKKDQNDTNLEHFLLAIGKLYQLGVNPSIEKLYRKVEFPVSRGTQSISSIIKWDHKLSYAVRKFPEYHNKATASDMTFSISLANPEYEFLADHCVDGKAIFPATGYLMLAWRRLAMSQCQQWTKVPVIFEDVQFRRPIFLSVTDTTKITVRLFEPSGEFVILEGNNVSSFGRIRVLEDDILYSQDLLYNQESNFSNDSLVLDSNDVYKELRIRGYDYGPKFRGVQELRCENFNKMYGKVKWTGNWISFMDAILHIGAVAVNFRNIFIPVIITSLRCDPKVLFEAIEESKQLIYDKNNEPEIDIENLVNDKELINDIKLDTAKSEEEDLAEMKKLMEPEIKQMEELLDTGKEKFMSILPVFIDMNLKQTVTRGIEVNGIISAPIPRVNTDQDVACESYQFIPNEENIAIETEFKKQVTEYLQVCSTLANKVLKHFGLNELIEMNNHKKVSEELIKTYLNDEKEEHVLLKIFNRILSSPKDENENLIIREKDKLSKRIRDEILNKPEFDPTKDIVNQVSKNERFIRPLLDIVSENIVPRKEIKVIEINLSNAIMAIEVDNYLASPAIYSITVGYTIVNNSIQNLNEDLKNKDYELLEWNPNEISFPDNIQAADLFVYRDNCNFWDLKLDDFLQEIYGKVKDKGFFLTVFRYKFTAPEIVLNRLLEQKIVKDYNLTKRIDEFRNKAQKIGFNVVCYKSDLIGSIAILFRKVQPMKDLKPKKQNIIEITADYEKWFEILKEKFHEMKEDESQNEKIWLIANDSSINGILGFVLCLRLEIGGERIRCVFDYDRKLKLPLNFSEYPLSEILINDLAVNVIRDGKLGTYRHINLTKSDDQFEGNDYYLNIGQRGDLTTLQWYDLKNMVSAKYMNDQKLGRVNQIKCKVYFSGLNFKDVLIASGRIVAGIENCITDCIIGNEFAGRRSDTGERVFGFCFGRGIATFVNCGENMITTIPEHWSMAESVSILTTYCTVWYALIDRAQLKKNETVLIHSGAGGVGQAAITVCQYYNCEIFVTVGTEEKRQFLTKEFNIPEDHIFNSRDIQFENQILSATKGTGVDIVLNSLAEEKLQASFRCVAANGRFVEIGKYDLQMNNKLGLFSFLKNISFISVTIENFFFSLPNKLKEFFDWIHENSRNGCVKPIKPIKIFEPTEAEQAFRHMSTGKHIGKLVIKVRDEEDIKTPLLNTNPTLKLTVNSKTFFNPNKVYIITGGLGGFGLELAQWMTLRGGKKIVLTSRTGVRSNYQRVFLKRLEEIGKMSDIFKSEIIISTHDSNTEKGAKTLLEEANKLGPIGGIFHLALVLSDSLYENQTIEGFRITCESKINTFVNFDKLTRDLYPDIDYFVCFSSVACGLGNGGQSNYGYANSVIERICEKRRSDGLHGLAIQYGPIGDVGLMADNDIPSLAAIVKQRILSCLDVFDKFIQSKHTIISSTVRAKRESKTGSLEERLINQLWSALGVDPKTLPNYVTLGELGMESMLAVELQQSLEREYGVKLTLNQIKKITVRQMKEFQTGNKDEMKKVAKDFKLAKANLTKIKFIIPIDTHTRLNGVQNGRPIYILPPVEGLFTSFEDLAKKINRPVIALNLTRGMNNMKTMKEISAYFMDLLKTLAPNGNYDIIGHSFGALILAKISRKAPIGRAVIIDLISDTPVDKESLNDEELFESIQKFIQQNMPESFRDRMDKEIDSTKDIDEKIKKIVNEIKEFGGKNLVGKDMEEIFKLSLERGKLLYSYRVKLKKKFDKMKNLIKKKYLKMNGKLLIIKPHEGSDDSDIMDIISESYNLHKEDMNENLKIEIMKANPEEVLFKHIDKVAELINQFLL